jgi:hypothetical protein
MPSFEDLETRYGRSKIRCLEIVVVVFSDLELERDNLFCTSETGAFDTQETYENEYL